MLQLRGRIVFSWLRLTECCEVVCWSESYTPAREAGLLMSGSVIRLKANVQADERTETLRLTGSEIKELKARAPGKNAALQLTLWVARHSETDLFKIHPTQ